LGSQIPGAEEPQSSHRGHQAQGGGNTPSSQDRPHRKRRRGPRRGGNPQGTPT
jgi:hypothetical protein